MPGQGCPKTIMSRLGRVDWFEDAVYWHTGKDMEIEEAVTQMASCTIG
jgi:hypothetical protein